MPAPAPIKRASAEARASAACCKDCASLMALVRPGSGDSTYCSGSLRRPAWLECSTGSLRGKGQLSDGGTATMTTDTNDTGKGGPQGRPGLSPGLWLLKQE